MYENYTDLKAARVTLRNAASRKDNKWWKLFARYAEIARRKLWHIEIGLLACLILGLAGCQTVKGVTGDSGWILTKMSKNIQTEQE